MRILLYLFVFLLIYILVFNYWLYQMQKIHGCDWDFIIIISLFVEIQLQFSPFCGTKQNRLPISRKSEKGHCYVLHLACRATSQWGSTAFDWWLVYSITFEEIETLSAYFAFWGIWARPIWAFSTFLIGAIERVAVFETILKLDRCNRPCDCVWNHFNMRYLELTPFNVLHIFADTIHFTDNADT